MTGDIHVIRPGAIALVTGASSGFGEAIAIGLAAREVRVIATARSTARLVKLKDRLGIASSPSPST